MEWGDGVLLPLTDGPAECNAVFKGGDLINVTAVEPRQLTEEENTGTGVCDG